ncbi:olfactory receptor 6M1-like [Mugil cephalus]|uniref:olfactory receptor 6M1-like n=1 Tax=Mugil cephalus TaxID=48193 RepID=UPI001FB6FEE3|nr:olfactory receptor 6M1-like [Mugil cephalus]
MDAGLNVTYITLDGHVEVHRYRYLYFVIMLTAYILIICCNATITYLIVIHSDLHEPMYMFVAALLINSILFSTNIYPKLLIDFLSEKQIISYPACLFQAFIFYFLSFSEFLLLAAMSYDRYVSICKPLQYPMIMRKTTVSVLLALAWLVPAVHLMVPVVVVGKNKLCSFSLKGIFCHNSGYDLYCVTSSELSVFGVIILCNTALFPMLFIVFTYTRILIVAHRSCGEVRRKAAQTCLPHLLVLINYSCLLTYDVTIAKLESDFPKIARFIMTLQTVTYNPLFNPIIYGLKMQKISKHLKKLFSRAKPVSKRTVRGWTQEAEEALQDCFDFTDWEALCQPQGEDISSMADCITEYIKFCKNIVVHPRTARCFANNKPWITSGLRSLLNDKRRAFRS